MFVKKQSISSYDDVVLVIFIFVLIFFRYSSSFCFGHWRLMYEIYIAPGDTVSRERSSEILIWNLEWVGGWVDGEMNVVAGSGRTCVRRREGSDLTALTCDSRAWGGRCQWFVDAKSDLWCGAPARECPNGIRVDVVGKYRPDWLLQCVQTLLL